MGGRHDRAALFKKGSGKRAGRQGAGKVERWGADGSCQRRGAFGHRRGRIRQRNSGFEPGKCGFGGRKSSFGTEIYTDTVAGTGNGKEC